MRLRRALAAAAGGIGLAAVANGALRARAGEFPRPLAGEHETYRWRGFDVGVTEAGDPSDPDLALFHGIHAAASSHEFAAVFEDLASEYHVLAPDLPGFGHSSRPPVVYSAPLYTAFVESFLEERTDEPTVLASSLSGAYAASACESVPVDRLVLVCPTTETMPRRLWLRSLLRSPLVGETLFNLLASKPSIRYFHADHGYADVANLAEETVEFEWLSAHQSGARFAPASFVSGYLDPDLDLAETLAGLDAETTLVWGREADLAPLSAGRDLAQRANVRLVVVDRSRLLPHVEHPAAFLDAVGGRFQRIEG